MRAPFRLSDLIRVDRRELMPRCGYPTARINASTSEGQLGSQVQAITGIDGANASPKRGDRIGRR
jgi:hypothetical protein